MVEFYQNTLKISLFAKKKINFNVICYKILHLYYNLYNRLLFYY